LPNTIRVAHIGPHPEQHCGISRYYAFLSHALREHMEVDLREFHVEEARSTQDEKHLLSICRVVASQHYDIAHFHFADGTFRKDKSEGFVDFTEEHASLLSMSEEVVVTLYELGPRLVSANRLPLDPAKATPEIKRRIRQSLKKQIGLLLDVASGVIVHTEEQKQYLVEDPDFGKIVRYRKILIEIMRQGGAYLPSDFFAQRTALRREMRSTYGISPDEIVFIHHGFLRPNKMRYDILPVLELRPNVVLLLAGGPRQESHESFRDDLLIRAKEKNLRVICTGWVNKEDIPKAFAAADVAVLPYDTASDSNVLPTGLVFGLPTVTSDLFCFKTAKDRYGDCIAICRSQKAFEAKMLELVDNPSIRDRMSKATQRMRDLDSWNAIADKTVAFYHKLLNR
jgi:glycosyltransferase involved in cell wall biosynthesis